MVRRYELTDRVAKILASKTVRKVVSLRVTSCPTPRRWSMTVRRRNQYKRFIRIAATIVVERDGHPAMVIGGEGRKTQTHQRSRAGAGTRVDAKVFLEVWVKVRSGLGRRRSPCALFRL